MPLDHELVLKAAELYGTPLYLYDGDLLRQRYQEIHQFIPWPQLKVLYAMKANYSPALLRILAAVGAGIDAVSPGDVLLARRCGFTPDRILFTANNITDAEMHQVHELGVLCNIDSLSRLAKFGQAFPGSELCLRFNPDVVAGAHRHIQTGGDLTKFGILLEDRQQALDLVQRHQLRVVGLHKHTGSGIKEFAAFLQAVQNLLQVATPADFPHLRFVDCGGGFAVPYQPQEARWDYHSFGRLLTEQLSDFCHHFGRPLELYFEPGKYIAAEAGQLLVRVNTLKDNQGRLIAGTDSGFSQLMRPLLYGAYHHIINLSNPTGPARCYDICGNICESGDLFAEQRELPEIREGDLLAIQTTGAYGYAMGGWYNLRPLPAEAMIDSGQLSLIRRRLSSAELVESILGECP